MLINFDRPKTTALILSIIYFLFFRFTSFIICEIIFIIVTSLFVYFKYNQIISAENRYKFSLYFSLFLFLFFILQTIPFFIEHHGLHDFYNNDNQMSSTISVLLASLNNIILYFVISYIFLYFPAILIAKNNNDLSNLFLLGNPLLFAAFVIMPKNFFKDFQYPLIQFSLSFGRVGHLDIMVLLLSAIDYSSIILFTFLFYNAFKEKITTEYKLRIFGFLGFVYFIFITSTHGIDLLRYIPNLDTIVLNRKLNNFFSEIFVYLPMKLWLMYFIFEFITKLISNLKTKNKFNDPIFMSSIMLFISAILVGIIAICFNLFRNNLFGMTYYSIIAFTGLILISFDLISSLYVSISYFIENKKPISLINLTKTAVFYAVTFEIIYLMLTKDYLPHDFTSKYNAQNILILFTIGSVLLKIIIKIISSFISMASINGILYLIKLNFLKNDELTQSES